MKEDIPQFIKQVNLYMPDDDEYIINNYPAKSLKQIANDLNRPHKSLISRFRRLGLRNKEGRKSRAVRHQEQSISMLEYIKLNAPARTEDIGNHFGISRKVAGNRLKTIQMNGINGIFIQSVRHGSYGAAWILGKQQKIKTMEPRTPKRKQHDKFNLYELPENLQKWFGLNKIQPPQIGTFYAGIM